YSDSEDHFFYACLSNARILFLFIKATLSLESLYQITYDNIILCSCITIITHKITST
ncbi:hypothetical protein ACJX0J_013947, partial [Zea mays]